MSYSEWQSGTTAPQLSGVYERREKDGSSLFPARYHLEVKKWRMVYVYGKGASTYQIRNGHLWQWRGEL